MHSRITALLAGLLLAASVHAASWQEGTSYSAGSVVDYNGKTYTALVSHTAYAGAGWNPASTPTLWKEGGSSTTPATPVPTPTPTATPNLPTPTPMPTPVGDWACEIGATPPPTGYCVIWYTPKPKPTTAPSAPSWDKTAVYTGGSRVLYNGALYEAKWWTQGDVPGGAEWGPWKLVSAATATPYVSPSPTPWVSPSPTPIVTLTPCPMPTPPLPSPDYIAEPVYDAAGSCVIAWKLKPRNTPTPEVPPTPTPVVTTSPTPTPSVSPAPANDKLLVGYLHASFANGSGYIRMNDVSDKWDFINLSFAEPTSSTSGEVAFKLCPSTECPNVESEADFIAAIKAKQAKGKKVQISIGGANGQVRLETTAAKDAFVRSVAAIIDKYGLDGLDVDFEGHSLQLNAGDNDVANPKAPVIVNLIAALKELKAKYGSKFTLTMAPETFFVQLGYSFYGGTCSGCDTRAGAYLPVIYALRNDLTLLHVQDYNSGPITGLDGVYHTMGNADFHVAMTDMLLKGFKVAGTNFMFPALRPDQIAIGLPANANAGGGFTTVGDVHTALDCLMKGTNCGSYKPGATYPGLRGLMTWSINWDKFNNFEFSTQHRAYFDKLPK
ncbi:chitinase [Chitinibacter sp. ZOR0017]|uniref:chitinase n=1 Tax=Chitinibacter sp. ZOR0017 TaxID=1339254 RepID=UPI0009DCB3C6|nr:carbohydrate-binding protein [Chitinibacter sp. ZOR0017]